MSDVSTWPCWQHELPLPRDGSRRAQGGRRLSAPLSRARHTDQPLVSYITVVRNAQHTLARTLQSVREQDWPQVEHIVVDGLSTDGTLAVIEQHAAQIDYLVSEADAGLYEALNKAIGLARGELICVLNADDWLTRDAARLAAQAYLQAGSPARQLILSAAWAVQGQQRTLWSAGRLDMGSYLRCANVCHNGVYATRGAYEASGPYSVQLRVAADFRWLMACVDAGVGHLTLEQPTVHYSMGGLSSNVQRHTADCAQVLQERFPYLDEAQVWGLMHAFHQYRPHLDAFASSRPAHLGRFLDHLAQTHAHQADLMRALALAGLSTLRHADDDRPTDRLTRAEKSRRSFKRRWMALRSMWVR